MNASHPRRAHRNQAGQSAAEFALTFPVLVLVLTGLAGFALLFYAYLTMQLAVREGTNSIVHNPSQTVAKVQTTVKGAMVTLNPTDVSIDVEPSDPSLWVSGVRVSVTAYYIISVPINPPGPIRFQAQSVMTIE